jgi:hypothetical protein
VRDLSADGPTAVGEGAVDAASLEGGVWHDLMTAFALLLIIEGLLPMIAPQPSMVPILRMSW